MEPKLRFKEFSGDWEEKKLDCLTDRINRKNKLNETSLSLTISAQYGLVDQETYFNRKVSSNDLSGYYLLKKGEFAYNKSYSNDYPFGAIKRLDNYNKGAVSTLYICFSLKQGICSDFIQQYFESDKWYKEIYMIAFEGARNHGLLNIAIGDFFNTRHKLPSLPEQTKIADFLSTVDDKIQNQQDKITHLENIKKGFMQKIFSRKIRFKDDQGNEFPEWEEEILGNVVNIIMGQSPNSNSYNEDKIGVPLVQGNADIKNRITSPTRYTNKPTKICKKDSLIMTVRAPVGYIGKANQEVCIGRGVCGVQVKKCNSDYIYQFLLSKEDSWDKISQGSTFTSISSNDIKNLRIELPYLEEQQKIADFLSSFDEKIDAEKETLEHLKELKKGLLQQMFV